MAFGHDERTGPGRAGPARSALFRYALIREAADPALSTRQRGRLVRDAGRPGARRPVRASRCGCPGPRSTGGSGPGGAAGSTRWCPTPAQVAPRTPAEVLELAVALKREVPARTAAQVARDPAGRVGLVAVGADPAAPLRPAGADHPPGRAATARRSAGSRPTRPTSCGPATRCTARLVGRPQGDPVRLHRRSQSGLLAGYRWAHREDTVRLEAALRAGAGRPRRPRRDLRRQRQRVRRPASCCGPAPSLGIRLVHSRPGQPAGPGQDRAGVPHRARAVPRRAVGPGRERRRPGRAEPAVHRLGRDRLPPPGALRDRADAAGPARRRRPAAAADPGRSCTRRSCGPSTAPSPRPRPSAARQHLRGRRRPGRPQGRAASSTRST